MRPVSSSDTPSSTGDGASEVLVPLGRVVRAHGVLGQIRVKRYHAASSLMRERKELWLRAEGEPPRAFVVRGARGAGDADLLELAGVATREAAEALQGCEVLVPRSAFPRAADDEIYLVDLIGLEAFAGEASLGRVLSVANHPSADCLVIGDETGTREIPMIEPYLLSVDLRERRIELAHVEDFDVERPKPAKPPKPPKQPKAKPT